jgi:hypothetical protein
MQGYSLASLMLLTAFLAANLALLRSGLVNGAATKDRIQIGLLIAGGQVLGAGIGLVIGLLSHDRRIGIPVSIFAGAISGGFCGGVFAVNIWFPLFPIAALVVCVVAAIIGLTRRPTSPPPPPSAAIGGSPFAAQPHEMTHD